MSTAERIQNQTFTYTDYLNFSEDERWEIIEGIPYCMSPAPSIKHQRIVSNLDFAFHRRPKDGCNHFIAPTDVVLDEFNIVQPDIFAVCDPTRIHTKNIQGAPNLIIEVASPSTEIKDRREKKTLYEQAGVSEYIIVFPERNYIERYTLAAKNYGPAELFNWDEQLPLQTFPELTINLWEIFEKEIGPTKQVDPTANQHRR